MTWLDPWGESKGTWVISKSDCPTLQVGTLLSSVSRVVGLFRSAFCCQLEPVHLALSEYDL